MTRALVTLSYAVLLSQVVATQIAERPPRSFPELHGTWLLDSSSFPGGSRRLVISATDTVLTVVRDAALPETYRFDGSRVVQRDPRTSATLDREFSLTLVADSVALTARTASPLKDVSGPVAGQAIQVVTDAYHVDGEILTIERNFSQVRQPAGVIVTFESSTGRQTLRYRRQQLAER